MPASQGPFASVLSRKFVDSRRRVGRGPVPPDRSFCGLPKPTTIHLVAPLSAGALPRHSVSGGEGSCPARRFVGVSLTRDTSVLSLKKVELIARLARLLYKEGEHAYGAPESTTGTDPR